MKTINFLSVLILSFLMTSAFSQGQRQQRTPEQSTQATVDWMTKDLSLDQATSKKVYDCILKYTKQTTAEMQKLGQDASSREARTAKRTEITAAQDKELKTILGDSKFELYKKRQAERRAQAQQRRQG